MSRWRRPRESREPETPKIVSEFAAPRPPVSVPARPTTTVGRNLELKGEIRATADLTVEGAVEGRVEASDHTLTIGVTGRATANLKAKTVIVRGMVVGNIEAAERVEILPTGTVCGDVTAKRLVLAEGSSFNGSVNLGGAGAYPINDAEAMLDEIEADFDIPEAPAARDDGLAMWNLSDVGDA